MAVLVSDAYPALADRFLVPHQPDGLARSLASKKEMCRLAREHSVPTPQSTFPAGIEDVRAFAASATFPVMLKGISGNRLHERTGRKMVIVDSPNELLRLYHEMEDPADPNLMLQEYIPGGDDVVWMFNGYFNHDSDCLVGLTGRKLRQTPVYTGATSLGVCLRNDVIDQTTRRWMKDLGYRGILDIGYRYDARDGQYKVLDVNPRIGGTFRLFVGRNGMDVARALYLDMSLDSTRRFDAVMARLGLEKVRSTTIGFGPFTFWRRPVLSEPNGRRLHRTLQGAADRRVPLVRSMGGQYLVLARKADDRIRAAQAAPAAKESWK
jgi:D-aspartate ligase